MGDVQARLQGLHGWSSRDYNKAVRVNKEVVVREGALQQACREQANELDQLEEEVLCARIDIKCHEEIKHLVQKGNAGLRKRCSCLKAKCSGLEVKARGAVKKKCRAKLEQMLAD